MSPLQSLLDAFHRGEVGFEELDAAVDACLREDPQGGDEVARLLDAARGRGLPQDVHEALLSRLARHGDAGASGTTLGGSRAAITTSGSFSPSPMDGSPELG
ncbi:MAG: hypothetical protein GWP74_19345, partial [Proteobacteria bacterium]|nr:hypothetical protein [Pseudomonadota bacterium]